MKKITKMIITWLFMTLLLVTAKHSVMAEVEGVERIVVGGNKYIVNSGELIGTIDGLNYDPITNTITMEDFYRLCYGGNTALEYRGDRDINIIVKGNNIIEQDDNEEIHGSGMCFWSSSDGEEINVNISGDGTLNFKYCLEAIKGGNANINISNITINSTSNIVGTYGNVTINNAIIKAEGYSGQLLNGQYGIYALSPESDEQGTKKKLTVSNSTVEIKGYGKKAIQCESYDFSGVHVYWGYLTIGYEMDKDKLLIEDVVQIPGTTYRGNGYRVTGVDGDMPFNYLLLTNVKQKLSTDEKVETKLAKVSLKSATNKKGKKVKLTWKKVSGVSGYQIQYATNKKFTKNLKKTTAKKSATSKTINKLKKKKTYYFRVRAYKTVNGKKVYGVWSKVKKVKIKK